MHNRSRGAALIMALLVVALVSAIALALMSQLQIDIQRSSLSFDADQAYLAAAGVRDWGIIEYDQIVANQKLQLPPPRWPVAMPTQTIPDGAINGSLTSAQGRFNINNLYSSPQNSGPQSAISGAPQMLFTHLLQYVEPDLSSDQAKTLTGNVATWFTGNNNAVYLQKQPPYLSSTNLMISPSELRLVDGFSADLVDKLSPYITALPVATPIDVNAAPKGLLIAAGLSESGADAVIDYLQNNGNFTNLDGFYAISQYNSATAMGSNQPIFTVTSNYYYAIANIQLGKVYFTAYYLLQYKQPNTPLQVIGYSQGSL